MANKSKKVRSEKCGKEIFFRNHLIGQNEKIGVLNVPKVEKQNLMIYKKTGKS